MKSTISFPTFLAGAACALAMAACDSVKDVPEEPFANLPPVTVVLEGTITNVSSLRAIVLMNNGDADNARSFLAGTPSVVNAGPAVVPFSFGAFPAGTPYNVTIKTQPFGKTCTVANGQGTLTAGVATNITVTCTNTRQRHDMVVTIPGDATVFRNLPSAKVRLTTEEEIIEKDASTADSNNRVTFPGALIDATGEFNSAPYTVSASYREAGSFSKCGVTNPTGTNPRNNAGAAAGTGGTPPAGPAIPVVGSCRFLVSGTVGYSLPAGVAFTPGTLISGLSLQLKDAAGTVLETKGPIDCAPPSATVTTGITTVAGAIPSFPVPPLGTSNGCAYSFSTLVTSSLTKGLYEVVVSQQPTNGTTPLMCVVANGGSVNVFTIGTTSPAPVDRANVLCRAKPAPTKQIQGVFRLVTQIWTPPTGGAQVTSTWDPFNFSVSNTATSNMLALFDDGTFLYGAHGDARTTATNQGATSFTVPNGATTTTTSTAPASGPGGSAGAIIGSPTVGGAVIVSGHQVEHGFYDYDPTAGTLKFTLVTDTNNGVAFPSTFSSAFFSPRSSPFNTLVNDTRTTTTGLSSTPNPLHRDNSGSLYMATPTMTGVTFGTAQVLKEVVNGSSVFQTVRTLSGEFGGAPGGAAWQTVGNCRQTPDFTANPQVVTANGPCLTAGGTYGYSLTNCTNTQANLCIVPANNERLRWILQEPLSIDNEMTGAWITQDHRRYWVWDHRTIFGTGAAVVGGHPSLNDACFTMEDLRQSSGFYVRRGSGPGCHPFVQAATNPAVTPAYAHGAPESSDYPTQPGAQGVPSLLPGFIGRIPGGQPFPGNTTASPVQMHIAPPGSFASTADVNYFPNLTATSFNWCTAARPGDTAEVLGLRYTSNNVPIDVPVYMCRTKVPLQ
jgi:hypothetical protein